MQAEAEFTSLEGRDGIKTDPRDEGCGFFYHTLIRFILLRTRDLDWFFKQEILSPVLLKAKEALELDGSMNLMVLFRKWESQGQTKTLGSDKTKHSTLPAPSVLTSKSH